ncbi:hypothetical protein CRV08_12075 [Halarcobacter ebronensis]|uniref:Uncharacterized protein n=1 Tax=Halarcobacter ebronensis TaxID=1462615 RepID=A0A4Q0Y975_9BACT|nr:hypothetical protein CRV08_12075 [Halarcobacter ebronensis]
MSSNAIGTLIRIFLIFVSLLFIWFCLVFCIYIFVVLIFGISFSVNSLMILYLGTLIFRFFYPRNVLQ